MMQQEEDEAKARRSLAILTCLYRGYILVDDRTTNAICNACFHQSSWVMYNALFFLLDYDEMSIERDDSEDDQPNQPILKEHHDGASSSEKKRQEKLLGNIRRKREDILLCTIELLKDPQGFTVRLLSRLQSCTERFEIKLMMMEVISQVVRTHSLVLLDLYSYFQKYVQSNEQDIKYVLEAVVWTCHEKVPPEKVKPLLKQIVERSLRACSCREDMLFGLNVVSRICMRMPLLITKDLLQNLELGMNLNDRAAIRATRGLIVLLREVCPSLDDGSKQVHNEIFEQILGRLQCDARSSGDDDVSHLFLE